VGAGDLALAELAAKIAKATEIKRELRIFTGPSWCGASLFHWGSTAQEGAVAKLIQRMDNSRLTEP
jgi:hypothetical protein